MLIDNFTILSFWMFCRFGREFDENLAVLAQLWLARYLIGWDSKSKIKCNLLFFIRWLLQSGTIWPIGTFYRSRLVSATRLLIDQRAFHIPIKRPPQRIVERASQNEETNQQKIIPTRRKRRETNFKPVLCVKQFRLKISLLPSFLAFLTSPGQLSIFHSISS